MKITDAVSVTELSRLLQKSRPTVYKYILDYEESRFEEVPGAVKELFRRIDEEEIPLSAIRDYCHTRFGTPNTELSLRCKACIDLITENQDRIDFDKLEHFLRKVIRL